MDLKVTRYEIADRVATLTLDRPGRLNSWTGRMHTEYRHLLERAENDPDVGVVVLTGAGRGFCAGADTAALETHVLSRLKYLYFRLHPLQIFTSVY